jgi:hypothetical protein
LIAQFKEGCVGIQHELYAFTRAAPSIPFRNIVRYAVSRTNDLDAHGLLVKERPCGDNDRDLSSDLNGVLVNPQRCWFVHRVLPVF